MRVSFYLSINVQCNLIILGRVVVSGIISSGVRMMPSLLLVTRVERNSQWALQLNLVFTLIMLKCLGRDVCYLVEFTSYTEMSVSVPKRSVSLVY